MGQRVDPNSEYSGIIHGKEPNPPIVGVSAGAEVEHLNLFGNWDNWRPEHEQQNLGYETSACLIFSGTDCLETLFNFYVARSMIDLDNLNWLNENGYFKNGLVNFSDRLPANYAEIIPLTGTYQFKANNALAEYLIPEAMLPYTAVGLYVNPDPTKGAYYHRASITSQMLNLALEFKRRFTITWFYVEDREDGLKSSPLQAVVRFANGDGILKPEGRLNHGVMVYGQTIDKTADLIDDSYTQRDKKYGRDYVFDFIGYKITINNTLMDIQDFIIKNDLKWVQNETSGQFGRIMRGKLRTINSNDRGALILLDEKVRNNKIIKDGKETPAKLTKAEWEKLPKEEF
jgi:hypothetical protein